MTSSVVRSIDALAWLQDQDPAEIIKALQRIADTASERIIEIQEDIDNGAYSQ